MSKDEMITASGQNEAMFAGNRQHFVLHGLEENKGPNVGPWLKQ